MAAEGTDRRPRAFPELRPGLLGQVRSDHLGPRASTSVVLSMATPLNSPTTGYQQTGSRGHTQLFYTASSFWT